MSTLTERAEQDRRIRNKRKSFVRGFRANSSLSKKKQSVSLKYKQSSMVGASNGKPGWWITGGGCQSGLRFGLWELLKILSDRVTQSNKNT